MNEHKTASTSEDFATKLQFTSIMNHVEELRAQLSQAIKERDEFARVINTGIKAAEAHEQQLATAKEALERIAREDYRGNAPWSIGVAQQALASINESNTTEQ